VTDWLVSPFAVVVIPFAGALAIALAGDRDRLRDALGWVTAIAFFAGVVAQVGPVLDGAGRSQHVGSLMPGLDIAFAVEPLGLIFALVAATLWLVATLYAQCYMKVLGYRHLGRFFACYAIALGAAAGVAFSANLLTLFVFYEVLSLSTYPLVAHSGTAKARDGARTYLAYLLATSIGLLLVAVLWVWHAAGTLEFAPGGIIAGHIAPVWIPVLAGLFMFGIGKAALMPVHRWLPAAMVAPAPVSALLHAVAVVKAGVFSVLKVAVFVFGTDTLVQTGAGLWISWVAAFTIVAASLIALRLEDLKARLAYSTISQLNYIVLGAMVATPLAVVGAAMHIAMHAVAKITLFFGAGAIQVAHDRKKVAELDGLGRAMPVTFGAFTLATLSIIGLPLFGGAWSKWYLVLGSLEAHQWVLVAALMASSLLNILYLLIIPIRAFFARPADGVPDHYAEAPWPMLVAMVLTAAGCVVLFFWPDPLFRLAETLVPGGAA
jgi:multicomponent Na+:H+ antiporter subunit D